MGSRYLYHSRDPNFPGTLEQQKSQYPNARWLAEPEITPSGTRRVGLLANGNEIHECEGVLVTIQLRDFDPELSLQDRSRVARARAQKGLEQNTSYSRKLDAVRAPYAEMSTWQFTNACARGEVDMGRFHAPLRALARQMIERREPALSPQSKRMTGERE